MLNHQINYIHCTCVSGIVSMHDTRWKICTVHVYRANTMTGHFKHPINHCNKAWNFWHDKKVVCTYAKTSPSIHLPLSKLRNPYLLPLQLLSNSQLYEVNFTNMCQSVVVRKVYIIVKEIFFSFPVNNNNNNNTFLVGFSPYIWYCCPSRNPSY